MPKDPRTPFERFAAKITAASNGCIEWIASTNSTGYGTFAAGGQSVMAHRWAYEYHVGPIPEGHVLDHLCRNRKCVNPDHLEPVTISTKTHCPAGHPYSGENLYIPPSRPNRMCRTCRRDQARRRKGLAA